jgi:hypothetical protein
LPDGFGWAQGWRLAQHVRTVADLDQDGADDIVAIANASTYVVPGSSSGLLTPTIWSDGHWVPSVYEGVDTDPRFFVDLDADGDRDVIGVDASADMVRYGLNNGSGFDDPVDWIAGIAWDSAKDSALLADVDGNGFPDFLYTTASGVTAYTTDGSGLTTTTRTTAGWPADASDYPDRRKYPIEAADIDGDGCADLVLFGADATYYDLSECNGSFGGWSELMKQFYYDWGWRVGVHPRLVADVNQDGLPDVIGFGTSLVTVYMNESTPGNVQTDGGAPWSGDFTATHGWATLSPLSGGGTAYGAYPRYLADVNGDGYPDVAGFGSGGAAIGINMMPIDGTRRFGPATTVASAFDTSNVDGNDNLEWWNQYACGSNTCAEFFPREVGDFDGDGRADFIGFDRSRIVYQTAPSETQFQ